MTFEDWFQSRQGNAYDSMYMFAQSAWNVATEQMQELLDESYADADEVLRPRIKHLESQLAAEREACAKVCEEMRNPWGDSAETADWVRATYDCAAAIRARSKER